MLPPQSDMGWLHLGLKHLLHLKFVLHQQYKLELEVAQKRMCCSKEAGPWEATKDCCPQPELRAVGLKEVGKNVFKKKKECGIKIWIVCSFNLT